MTTAVATIACPDCSGRVWPECPLCAGSREVPLATVVAIRLAHLAEAIVATRFTAASEAELQAGLGVLLRPLGGRAEVSLARSGRIDFLVDRIGVEVKVHGSISQVVRQVLRYLRSDELDALILVTTRGAHRSLQQALAETIKPVRVVLLEGGLL